ncbi:MAG: hypothetical protein ACREBV_00155 [Candidatus Zixiibacteriota bacterium]
MGKFKKISLFIIVLAGLLAAVVLVAEEVQEEKEIKVPDKIITAFQKSFPGVVVRGYDKEVVDGKAHFEIETQVDKLEKTFVYLEDATLLQIEEEIMTKSLPEIIVASLNKAHPKSELDEADKITRGSVIEYEVVIEVDKKEMELLVAADGKILSVAELDDNDENDDDDEEEDDDENSEDDEDEGENEDDDEGEDDQ